ncbi:MAG TPA: DUF1579 family protein [Candidatus Angelobacter sp.]|nr:DUF1579 family protein [Candidatus Angelobacter sp.]
MTLVAAYAVAQMPAPTPAPELSKLDYFAGHWSDEGEIKPGPMGPGGKYSATDDAHWMDGKFFLVMNSEFKGSTGDIKELQIFGFDPKQKVYTYAAYNSAGEVSHYTGTVDGDTWTWSSNEMGGMPLKNRYSIKALSPASYSYKFEFSPDGTSWVIFLEGKATKK